MVDFEVNYRAGERLLAGETLYRPSDGHFMFKYFPFAAMLYVPLSFLPLDLAKAVWYGGSVIAAIALFVLSKRLVSGAALEPWYVLVLPPVVLAKFLFRELKLGQINILTTLLLLFMVMALVSGGSRGERRAGALWGLATAIKPYGLIFLPFFAVTGRVAALVSGLAVLAAALALPSIFYGFGRNFAVLEEWFITLSASTPAQLGVNDNVSLLGFFTKWTESPHLASRLALVAVLTLAAATLVVLWRGRGIEHAPVLECGLLLTFIPLVSPMGWDYQLLTSVLGVTLLAHHLPDVARPWRVVLLATFFAIGLSIYDLMGRRAYGAFMAWSILTPCFLVLVGYLFHLRWRRLH